ncbi:hypothetical protein BDZ97DRAFT_1783620 [Flammula alnicola]|nr:hypothetical protein BDZ97DRAFT_1887590 [Flammula alnicola]KAF8956164.1 hypothetical protein BDZ97DRAFT_1853020 [Flammula alnicola]KAF8972187.1 hypothetical protein BDZ97DRAFT_1783620 [Flammula alnicola]
MRSIFRSQFLLGQTAMSARYLGFVRMGFRKARTRYRGITIDVGWRGMAQRGAAFFGRMWVREEGWRNVMRS